MPAGKRIVGYITNWDHYANGYFQWTSDVANKLTHVNYAFASISYSKDHDVWYVHPSDAWADVGDCAGAADCYGQDPDCIELPGATCGGKSNPTVSLVPYIGADVGATCPSASGCFNEGGAPGSRGAPAPVLMSTSMATHCCSTSS